MDTRESIRALAARVKSAARQLAVASSAAKDRALRAMAGGLEAKAAWLKAENAKDLAAGEAAGLSAALLDRLRLNDKRIAAMAEGLRQVAALPDPVGAIIGGSVRPNGLRIAKVRVPLGVIAIIYESRPNVTADAAGLCLKAGNGVILRGGKEALASNVAIWRVLQEGLGTAGLPAEAVALVETTDRAAVDALITADGLVDVVIPRGGEGLIRRVVEGATIPVIKHYKGVCHVYVDASADLAMAEEICLNAKCQRPATCNAMETLLVHGAIAQRFLPAVCRRFAEAKVELRGCERTRALVPGLKAATEDDWYAEYLDLILAVRVVDSTEAAMEHIARYGSAHSDAIVTTDVREADKFVQGVDSAAVYVNASTRFTDGFEFGLGAEIGISTDKLHARGPMGLEELTSYKFVVHGSGQLRQ
ncbi:MAG TPA: glutamate-5-semialdehyde dehydrogenase [Planctomycetota bacterium]|nr:glutamate-5-semialdehyde dehydrogenase [Planctomycetota bacterium]HRR81940.1 glutamate-5-semialdehyde dehydrogenase [Planctomycetota bacterium]HRT96348.1 glutamate-5-semialdehyde dehydrogenase [Planctomycetota bacterium]